MPTVEADIEGMCEENEREGRLNHGCDKKQGVDEHDHCAGVDFVDYWRDDSLMVWTKVCGVRDKKNVSTSRYIGEVKTSPRSVLGGDLLTV